MSRMVSGTLRMFSLSFQDIHVDIRFYRCSLSKVLVGVRTVINGHFSPFGFASGVTTTYQCLGPDHNTVNLLI